MSCNCGENSKENKMGRKSFLSKLIGGIVAVIGGFLSLPLLNNLLEPVIGNRRTVWRKIGDISDFSIGETKKVTFRNASRYDWSGKIDESAAYIRRDEEDQLIAFSVNCSHLGCPVRWEESPQMFFCPCHGGAFYRDGTRAAGPPNRGLYAYPLRVRNGNVELETEAIPVTNIDV
ncbi:Rieske (2Fe-2S) protein [Zunongwangia sp. F363]|uniref:Rieske (2Fe-2S) protein n=1 Tax=Autumnicola tepida TaxID=3075595 RepID=A0ABU3C647_9FLAO|nr:Rieske (2Fe-2S) protein [Zunongwangia sp. F363]MDT0641809.1 Rieske (2Fe-2S) protein [Zunongwangia sp. F363]